MWFDLIFELGIKCYFGSLFDSKVIVARMLTIHFFFTLCVFLINMFDASRAAIGVIFEAYIEVLHSNLYNESDTRI